jgi:hypothetical protein
VVLAAAAYKGKLSWCEEGPMMYDNQADAQHLYGGIDRLRANILVSQAAYAEASKRATRNRDIAAAKVARKQVVGEHALLSL